MVAHPSSRLSTRRLSSPRPQPAHFLVLLTVMAPGSKPCGAVTRGLPAAWLGTGQSPAWAPWGPGQQQAMLCPCGLMIVPLIIRGDINVLPVGLLRGDTPPVDMVGTLLLLLGLRPFLLQLLPFVFCPPILEPHLHLGREGGAQVRNTQSSQDGLHTPAKLGVRWGTEATQARVLPSKHLPLDRSEDCLSGASEEGRGRTGPETVFQSLPNKDKAGIAAEPPGSCSHSEQT